MLRRLGAILLCLLLALPSTLASGSTGSDPAGDQQNAFPYGLLLSCHDDATDVIALAASSDGATLALETTVVDPAGSFSCTGPPPTLWVRRSSYRLNVQDPANPVESLMLGVEVGPGGTWTCVTIILRAERGGTSCAQGGALHSISLPLAGVIVTRDGTHSYDLRGAPMEPRLLMDSHARHLGVTLSLSDEASAPAFTA